jgi:hypothetical protein
MAALVHRFWPFWHMGFPALGLGGTLDAGAQQRGHEVRA